MAVRVADRPEPGRFSLSRLGPGDEAELVRFLARHPSDNAYFIGQVERGALDDELIAGTLVGVYRRRELVGAACLGSNLVLSRPLPDACMADLARASHEAGWLLRVVVGEDDVVARFMRHLGTSAGPIALERAGQLLFEVDRDHIARDARSAELRPAQPHELDTLMECDLAMVREELGMDPFSADWSGFKRGWYRRVMEWRAWVVGPLGGPIRFKVDQAAVSPLVVQLAGVWTRPEERGRGLARRALGEMCHLLLREAPRVCLYVHPDNEPAVRLYRSLGFRQVGHVRSVWLAWTG
ncbi:MAG: GNAT family N-acetyltransferase [Deltaproteobacteria bacterium]|nr:GNAT family N-acetyltransferase [Deltaproteobacteria bacterium]